LNREESIEVIGLLIRAQGQVVSKSLGLARVALKNDKQYAALHKQLKTGESDVRQAALASLQKAGILDPSLSWEEVRHMR
jgi:hypothetical protein